MPENFSLTKSPVSVILQAVIMYLFLVITHGYVFGHQDLIEVLSYLNYLEDPSLYAGDFYIQNITARVPNERWMFVQVLHFFNISSPWSFLVSHFIVSVCLLTGMLKTAQFFLKDRLFSFVAVLATVFVFYRINLGGNELYYNTLTASLTAKTLGIWSIYLFLKDNRITSFLLLIPASLIHPIAGLQLFMLFTGILGVEFIRQGFPFSKIKEYWPILAYLATAGVWLYLLEKQFSGGELSNAAFFEIINFRLAHHFIPSAFGLKNYMILGTVFLIAWIYYWRKNTVVFWFFNFAILGLIVYAIGVEVFKHSLFLSTQWFKTTIWLKFFGMVALSGIALDLFDKYLPKLKQWLLPGFGIAFLGLTVFLIIKVPQRHPTSFDMPWSGDYNDELAITKLAKNETTKSAVFITPTYFTHLKYYGKRSTYVDYKAMVHHKSALPQWLERITAVYQQQGTQKSLDGLSGKSLQLPVSASDVEALQAKGITHMITDSLLESNAKLLGQKGKYYLYEL